MKTYFLNLNLFWAVVFMAFTAGSAAQDKSAFKDPKKQKEYLKASLSEKFELNKKWAMEEVLPSLSFYEVMVNEEFEGVKAMGRLVVATDFKTEPDIDSLTTVNPEYWRAVMEMDPRDQIIPVTKMFMLVSQGYFDHANLYAEVIGNFSSPNTEAGRYLEEFSARMKVFYDEVNTRIGKGIAEHDKGNYLNAVKIYNELLKAYPNSAWGLYEKYYSRSLLSIKNGVPDTSGQNWKLCKVAIYKCSPMYYMDVRATNSKEGFLLFRRQEIRSLFKFKAIWLKDMYTYADIALDLGVYDFAAQLFWLSFTQANEDELKEKSLYRYLYTLEKLGIPQWKENFAGDFPVIFKAIDEERQKAMLENAGYKYFAK